MLKPVITICLCLLLFQNGQAQINKPNTTAAQQLVATTGEDSLNSFGPGQSRTVISGYGELHFQNDVNENRSTAELKRAVLFVGHKFTSHIAFFSELEIEDGKIEGGGVKGEIAMEQVYLKFALNPRQYFVAGLFIPRIGIVNENHLPINFNGVERPITEQVIIPSTWREIGVGFYGQTSTLPLTYSIALLNGLNSEGFEHGSGFRGGRAEGQNASANSLAVTGAVQFFAGNWKFQASGYMGGTTGMPAKYADTLNLQTGVFGAPLYLAEANIQYGHKGISFKALGCNVSIPEASSINLAFNNNTPEQMYGAYAELGYNLLETAKSKKWMSKQLIIFARYEMLDMNVKTPANGVNDGTVNQTHLIAGFSYYPIPQVAIKADVRMLNTGAQNILLSADPYKQNNSFINLAIGYSF